MLTFLAVSVLSATPAQPSVEAALAELNRLVEVKRVALSPDGSDSPGWRRRRLRPAPRAD